MHVASHFCTAEVETRRLGNWSRLDPTLQMRLIKGKALDDVQKPCRQVEACPTRQSSRLVSRSGSLGQAWERGSVKGMTFQLTLLPWSVGHRPDPKQPTLTLCSHQAWASRRRSTLPATVEAGCPLRRDIRDLFMRELE